MTGFRSMWRFYNRRAPALGIFDEVRNTLQPLARAAEDEFLEVGAKLEEFTLRCRGLSSGCQEAAGLAINLEGSGLEQELNRVAECGHGLQGRMQPNRQLEDIGAILAGIPGPLRNLGDAVRSLRVMGTLIRIESARVGAVGEGFEGLADEVKGLAAAIEEQSDALGGTAGGLLQLVRRVLVTTAGLDKKQKESVPVLVGRCSAGLRVMAEEHERGIQATQRTGMSLGEASEHIAALVTALQAHDAFRQQIEHVCEALARYSQPLSREISNSMAHAARLQVAQLQQAESGFLQAVNHISGELDGIGISMCRMTAQVRELWSAGGAQDHSNFEQLEESSGEVSAALTVWVEAQAEFCSAAGSVNQATVDLGNFVKRIEEIGARMLRLALNSEIRAAQIGAAGNVMEAVVSGIRAVVSEAEQNTAGVKLAIERVAERARLLAAQFGTESEQENRKLEDLTRELRESIQALRGANAEACHRVESIQTDAQTLAGELKHWCECIRSTSVARGGLRESIEKLSAVAAADSEAAGEPTAGAGVLEGAENRYTMHSERIVHAAVVGEEILPLAASESPSEFGDNVQLF